jgi:hypothetical protein
MRTIWEWWKLSISSQQSFLLDRLPTCSGHTAMYWLDCTPSMEFYLNDSIKKLHIWGRTQKTDIKNYNLGTDPYKHEIEISFNILKFPSSVD